MVLKLIVRLALETEMLRLPKLKPKDWRVLRVVVV